jgi:hypothetical protein
MFSYFGRPTISVWLQLIWQADAIFFSLNFIGRQSLALFLGFNDSTGQAVNLWQMIAFVITGFQPEFAHCDASSRRNVSFVTRLHNPASID